MACTKQVYNVAATWTASQLADSFRSAFIDAGLMTDWFDSFLSGTVENRVMRVVCDNTKTYGTIYYWFMFTTGGVFLQTVTGFNTTTHVPSGTQYQDWFNATTNATTYTNTLFAAVNTTNFSITRYTSQVNTDASCFYLRNGTSYLTFFFGKGVYANPNSLIDQNKFYFNGHILAVTESQSSVSYSVIGFRHMATQLRRTIYCGVGTFTGTTPYLTTKDEFGYTFTCVDTTSGTGSVGPNSIPRIINLPRGRTSIHTGLTENYSPLVTNVLMSPFLPALPSDFGIASFIDNITMVVGDTFVVSSGSNEWDMLGVAKNTAIMGQTLFVARTI
jgi:hypothetical protein